MSPGLLLANVDAANPEFRFLAAPHVVAMILTVLLPLLLAWIIRRAKSEKVTRTILWSVGGVMMVNELFDQYYHITELTAQAYLQDYLPLHLCDISVILVIILMFTRKFAVYEVVFFWGLAGASNSVITPDLTDGFPSVNFMVYFISHSGIIIGCLLATWGLKMRPTFESVVKAFVIANLYGIPLIGVNLLCDSNYMFLCKPPVGTTPFFFLPWPWYLLFLDLFAFLLFTLFYSPFWLRDQFRRPRDKPVGAKLSGAGPQYQGPDLHDESDDSVD